MMIVHSNLDHVTCAVGDYVSAYNHYHTVLREKLGNTAVEKGLEQGKNLDWKTVVQELIAELKA